MQIINNVFLLITGATGFFIIIQSVSELINSRKGIGVYTFALFFSIGVAMIAEFLGYHDSFSMAPKTDYINDCLEFFIGGSLYAYCLTYITGNKFKTEIEKGFLVLIIPGIINLVIYTPLLLTPNSELIINQGIHYHRNYILNWYYAFINHGAGLWFIISTILFLLHYKIFDKNRKYRVTVIFYSTIFILVNISLFINNFLHINIIRRLVFITMVLITISLYFFFSWLKNNPEVDIEDQDKEKYISSKLKNMNLSKLTLDVEQLLCNDQVLCDQSINLETMAKRLSITPHQLSEFINKHYNMSFRLILNNKRVELVKKCLKESPEKNILEIAMDCGFNSKSTFNNAFIKLEGITPSQFRKTISQPNKLP